MQNGDVDVLMFQGNPRFELPLNSKLVEAVAKVPFVVSFRSEPDETAILANLVLPDNHFLESWGYQFVAPATDRPMISAQQPVVTPLYDTRATTDVILALAQAVGAQPPRLPAQLRQFLKTAVKLGGQDATFDTASSDTIWAGWRRSAVGGLLLGPGVPEHASAAPSLTITPATL